MSNDKLFPMSIGIVFHSFGAATEKALVTRTVRVWVTARNSSADDLSTLAVCNRRVDCLPVGGVFQLVVYSGLQYLPTRYDFVVSVSGHGMVCF